MTNMFGRMRVPSVVVGTLLIVGLLGPIPSILGQQPEQAQRPKVRVLQRALLGRSIGDLGFVPNGPFADHIIMLVGFEVLGLPANAGSDDAIRKLFDLRQQSLDPPTGIAYIASEGLFAVVAPAQPTQLFVSDYLGRPYPHRTIRYLGGYMPDHVEGLAYVPSTSPMFPDHLLMVSWNFLDVSLVRIQVIRRDGQVAAAIPVPDDIFDPEGVFGVAFLAPDGVLVTDGVNGIWTLDFNGNIVSGPRSTELLSAEGIVQLPDGRVVTGEGAQLRFYDAALNRLPQDDRDASTGAGLVLPQSVTWNSDTSQHLILARTEESGGLFLTLQVAAVPISIDSSAKVVDLSASGVPLFSRVRATAAYLPDEHLIALGFRRRGSTFPAQIVLYDNAGTLVERVNIDAVVGASAPLAFTYIPPTREFAMTTTAQPSTLRVLTRAGALAREIDLPVIGFSAVYFDPSHSSGGRFLITDGTNRAVVTDFNGNILNEFDYRDELELSFVRGLSAITTGRQAGAFSAIDFFNSEIVVFRLREED